ncbi:sugar transferase [bacterium BMS3Abin03]|nr:sugar transferase [bacterium BMS3Abin03]MCG6960647.1 sugar transferase [bacterium BMS3Abin03]
MTLLFSSIIKRCFDTIFSVMVLVITLPLSIIIIIFLLYEHKRFPILLQSRGLTLTNGKVKIIKFRTLLENHEREVAEKKSENIFYKPQLKKYVPPLSGWLRKTGLDELPQFLNVLTGKMSVVGPRPLSINDLNFLKEKYTDSYNKREQLTVKPGISGIWQLYGDRKKNVENLIELDSLYQSHHTFLTDIKIIVFSTYLVVTANNSDAIVNNTIKDTVPMKYLINAKTIGGQTKL